MKKQFIERIDALFTEWDHADTPGCVLGLIQDGELIYTRGYGQADLEYGIPITADTLFYIASASKQFTAACILLLAQSGQLSLQADIREVLPEMPAYPQPTRIEHLIYHTSGLREHGVLSRMAGLCMPDYRLADAVALLARQQDVNYPAGEMYLYNNAGYVLQAEIVQRVSGQPFSRFIKSSIFEPLDMRATLVVEDSSQIVRNSAASYDPDPSGGYRRHRMTNNVPGSAGVMTTVGDLFRWDQNFDHPRIGGESFARQMEAKGRLNSGQEIGYGFGLMHGEIGGLRAIYHGGTEFGFRSLMARFPEKRFSAICLSNLGSFSPYRIVQEIAEIFFQSSSRGETRTARKDSGSSKAVLQEEDFLGLYCDTNSGAHIRLSLQQGQVFAEVLGTRLLVEIDSYETAGEVQRIFLSHQNNLFPMSVQLLLEKALLQSGWRMKAAVESSPYPVLTQCQPMQYDVEELAEYVGVFYSPELQATYELTIRQGQLYTSHLNGPKGGLKPGPKDFFTLHGLSLLFFRDENQQVKGFRLWELRARGVEFLRFI